MFLQNMTRKIFGIYHEYPRTFWNVVVISFIDHIGDARDLSVFCPLSYQQIWRRHDPSGRVFAAFSLSGFAVLPLAVRSLTV